MIFAFVVFSFLVMITENTQAMMDNIILKNHPGGLGLYQLASDDNVHNFFKTFFQDNLLLEYFPEQCLYEAACKNAVKNLNFLLEYIERNYTTKGKEIINKYVRGDLISGCAKQHALQGAVEQGSIESIALLLKYKANPNQKSQTIQNTSLHQVARENTAYTTISKHKQAVKLLLFHNADPTIKNVRLKTPSDIAYQRKRTYDIMHETTEDQCAITSHMMKHKLAKDVHDLFEQITQAYKQFKSPHQSFANTFVLLLPSELRKELYYFCIDSICGVDATKAQN